MIPAVPLPEDSGVQIPVDAKLKNGWRYEVKRDLFISNSGESFCPSQSLPDGSRIVYKVPSLAEADSAKLSKPERDLQKYIQIILPPKKSPEDFVDSIQEWPCLESAQVGPDISLPK